MINLERNVNQVIIKPVVLFVYVLLKVEEKNVKLIVFMLFIRIVFRDGIKRMINAHYVENLLRIIMIMSQTLNMY
jgi:hypothetical protein